MTRLHWGATDKHSSTVAACCSWTVSGKLSLRGASNTVEAVRTWAGWALFAVAATQPFVQPALGVLGQRAQVSDGLLAAAALLGVGFLAVERHRISPLLRVHGRFLASLGIFGAVLLVSALLGERDPRWGKLVGSWGLLALAALVPIVVDEEQGLRRLTRAWLLGAFGCAAIGVLSLLGALVWKDTPWLAWTLADQGTLPAGDYPRLRSTFLNPNMLCTHLTLSAGLTVGAVREGWLSRAWGWTLGALLGVCAAFTLSLGLGGLPLLAVALAPPGSTRLRAGARWGAGLLALGTFASGWVSWAWPLRASARVLTWTGAWDTFLAHPLLGAGWGAAACHVRYVDVSGRTLTLTDAHHLVLSVAAQAGLLGVLALGAVAAALVKATWGRPLRPLASAALLSVLVVVGYQGLTGAYEDARHVWLALGLALASAQLPRS